MSRPLKTKEKFIEDARKKHGDKFNYDKVDYRGKSKTVIITCPEHGDFSQTPDRHLASTYGCSKCADSDINTNTRVVNGVSKRTCYLCKIEKELSLEQFCKRKHGLDYICRLCSAQSYRAKRELVVEKVRALKEQTPCKDCGVMYPHYVLDFDHIGDDKIDGLSEIMHSGSPWVKVQAEIDKCEVVCSNCHRKRSWRRMHPDEK